MENKKVLFIIPKHKRFNSLKEFANKLDAPVHIENDEKSGYKALKSGSFDLVVSSMFAGQMNGYELISKIKKDKIDCGIILIMGGRKENLKKELLKKGVYSFVKKTNDETELSKEIECFFKEKSAGKRSGRSLEKIKYDLENKVFDLEQKLCEKSEELKLLKDELTELHKDYKDTKKRLEKKRRYLVNSERMLSIGQMTASIVHEINNPMTVITSLAGVISLECKNNEKVTRYNEMLAKNIENLREFTQSILAFANPKRGEKLENIDVNVAIYEVMAFYVYEMKKRGIEFKGMFGKRLPAIKLPKVKFQQIILNTLKNAVFASKKSNAEISIRTSCKKNNIIVEIKDNGRGINKDKLENIFQPFFTTKSKEEGSGLGLYICKEIIDMYNGEIEVKSVYNKGATVIIKFPAVKK